MAAGSVPSVKKSSNKPATAAAPLTGGSNSITCSYCQREHLSNLCGVVTQPMLEAGAPESRTMFRVLWRGHVSRECSSHKRCAKINVVASITSAFA